MKSLTWILTPLLVLLQYEIWFAPGGVTSIWRTHQQLRHEVSINNQWQARNQSLTIEISDLKNGVEALEDHARNDLGMIKTTEVFYQLPD
jgi:cell division protein FtsB